MNAGLLMSFYYEMDIWRNFQKVFFVFICLIQHKK